MKLLRIGETTNTALKLFAIFEYFREQVFKWQFNLYRKTWQELFANQVREVDVLAWVHLFYSTSDEGASGFN
jgi:hypothetical protein